MHGTRHRHSLPCSTSARHSTRHSTPQQPAVQQSLLPLTRRTPFTQHRCCLRTPTCSSPARLPSYLPACACASTRCPPSPTHSYMQCASWTCALQGQAPSCCSCRATVCGWRSTRSRHPGGQQLQPRALIVGRVSLFRVCVNKSVCQHVGRSIVCVRECVWSGCVDRCVVGRSGPKGTMCETGELCHL